MRFIFLLLFVLFTSHLKAQNWQLLWSDEFNGNSLNSNNWESVKYIKPFKINNS